MSRRIFLMLAASTVVAAAVFSDSADRRSSQNHSSATENSAPVLKPPRIRFLGVSRVPAGEGHLRLIFEASNPNEAPLPYRGYLAEGFAPPLHKGVIAPHYLIEFRRDGKWKPEPIGWCGTGAGPVQLPARGTAQFAVDVPKDNWHAVKVGVDWFATPDRKGVPTTTWSDVVTPEDAAKSANDETSSKKEPIALVLSAVPTVNAEDVTIEINKTTQGPRSGQRFRISVVEKYNLPTITVSIAKRDDERLLRADLIIYDQQGDRIQGDRPIAGIPVQPTAATDSEDQVLVFHLARDLAPKCRLGILVTKTAPDVKNVRTTYLVDLQSYFPKP